MKIKANLYFRYLCELAKYNINKPNKPSRAMAFIATKNILLDPEIIWNEIISDDGEEIGFLLLGVGKNKNPETDIYIAEAFVLEPYRRRGYMTEEVSRILQKRKGLYSLYIFDTNPVKKFWDNVFEKNGYEKCEIHFQLSNNAGKEYAYKPKN